MNLEYECHSLSPSMIRIKMELLPAAMCYPLATFLLVLHTWPDPSSMPDSNLHTDVSSILMCIYERLHTPLTFGTFQTGNH